METKKDFLLNLIDKLSDQINEISVDLVVDCYDYFSSYISDSIAECADDNIPIYYSEREEWMRNDDNAIEYMERAVDEGLVDTSHFDFWGMVVSGIYLQCNDLLYDDYDSIIECAILYNLLDIIDELGLSYEKADECFQDCILYGNYDVSSAITWEDVRDLAHYIIDDYFKTKRGENNG